MRKPLLAAAAVALAPAAHSLPVATKTRVARSGLLGLTRTETIRAGSGPSYASILRRPLRAPEISFLAWDEELGVQLVQGAVDALLASGSRKAVLRADQPDEEDFVAAYVGPDRTVGEPGSDHVRRVESMKRLAESGKSLLTLNPRL